MRGSVGLAQFDRPNTVCARVFEADGINAALVVKCNLLTFKQVRDLVVSGSQCFNQVLHGDIYRGFFYVTRT